MEIHKKKCKYITIEDIICVEKKKFKKSGRPKKGQKPDEIVYQINGSITPNETKATIERKKAGFFIIVTNDMDSKRLNCSEILQAYKNQGKVERGFRFLKDPSFLSSAIFLEKPERVEALLMVMTLCLMVYAAFEYKVRKQLKKEGKFFLNQLKKPKQNPTAKWIFFCFYGIHIYSDERISEKYVINIKERHRIILDLLGHKYWKFYT